MNEVLEKYGDLEEYPVIPLLRRTEKFPLVFNKKGSLWDSTDMAHTHKKLCRRLER